MILSYFYFDLGACLACFSGLYFIECFDFVHSEIQTYFKGMIASSLLIM